MAIRRRRGWRAAWAAVLVMAPLPGSTFAAPFDASEVALLDQAGRIIEQRTVIDGVEWCLLWNHSVTGFEVSDCFVTDAGRLRLVRSHQPDFAAGLGHLPGRGVQRSDGAGGYWIEAIDAWLPAEGLALRVGASSVDHRILWPGESSPVSLSASAAGQRVLIRARPVSSLAVETSPDVSRSN